MKLARYNVHRTTHTPLSLPPPLPRHTSSSRLSALRENITVCIKRPRCDMEIGYRFRAGCTVRKIRVHTARGVRFTVLGILPTCPTDCGHDWLLTIYRFVILTSLELLPCFILCTHLHCANSKVLRMHSSLEHVPALVIDCRIAQGSGKLTGESKQIFLGLLVAYFFGPKPTAVKITRLAGELLTGNETKDWVQILHSSDHESSCRSADSTTNSSQDLKTSWGLRNFRKRKRVVQMAASLAHNL